MLLIFLLSTSYAHTTKEFIDQMYISYMAYMKNNLSTNCLSVLSPVISSLEASHELFLNDNPLEAVHKHVELQHDILPTYKHSGCDLYHVTNSMLTSTYMQYYLDLKGEIEKPHSDMEPTDFEKSQLVNVASSISNKIMSLCHSFSCGVYEMNIIYHCESIDGVMRSNSPDYYQLLSHADGIKLSISEAWYRNTTSDKRYRETLSWAWAEMTYLYKIPKKYLLEQTNDFRHNIASEFVEYLINYNNKNNHNAGNLTRYSQTFYRAAQYHSLNELLGASIRLSSIRYDDSYHKRIKDISADEFANYITELFNIETYNYFMSYYEREHGVKRNILQGTR